MGWDRIRTGFVSRCAAMYDLTGSERVDPHGACALDVLSCLMTGGLEGA